MTNEEVRDLADDEADARDMALEDAERDGYVECPGCGTWVRDRGIDILYHVMKEVHGGQIG